MSEHPSAHTRGALQAALAAAPAVDLSGIDPPVRAEPWALRPDAVALLVALVRELRPTHILELGSGVSTRAFAWAAEEAAIQCTVTSVDHDAEFLEVSRHALRAPGDGVTVEFEHAPVVLRQVAGRFLPVYSLADRPRRPADLILIDGPPELLCGREGTLYQAMALARPGTLALLDDANRAHERAVLDAWRADFGDAIEVRELDGFDGGLAAILVNQPVLSDDVLEHTARVAARELASVAPDGAVVLVADIDSWGAAFEDAARTGAQLLPFPERDGVYWGPPADDAGAIAELDRLRDAGAAVLAFGPGTGWWLEYYEGFERHLRRHYDLLIETPRLRAFDLRDSRTAPRDA